MQKLITEQLKKWIPNLWSQEWLGRDAICYVHYFFWWWDWYVLEYDWENELFWIVIWEDIEYWPFYLSDFERINKNAWYSKIERDIYWKQCKVGDIEKLKDFLCMRDERPF